MGKGDKSHKRKKAGAREPNGRPSRRKEDVAQRRQDVERAAFEEGPMQTVLKARRRHSRPFVEPAKRSSAELHIAVDEATGRVHAPDFDEPAAKAYRDRDARPVTKAEMEMRKLQHRGSVLGNLWADGKITDAQRAAGMDYCQRYITYAALNGLPRATPQGPSYGAPRGGTRPERLRAAAAAKAEHMRDQHILRRCTSGVLWAIKRACVTDEAAPLHLILEGLQALVDEGR